MREKFIVFLHDLSEGVRNLSKVSAVTNLYPFLSCAGVETDKGADIFAQYDFVKSVAEIARVSVCAERTGASVGNDYITSGGDGVTVAVIDTGISSHIDFTLPQRIVHFVDLIADGRAPYDDNGHGTAVAGVLAGSGLMSGGKHRGVAPGAKLVAIKAINSSGEGSTLEILQSMQWLYNNHKKYNIKVACMSFGSPPAGKNDPLALGAAALWEQGIIVVASGGNAGPDNSTIMSPGICPNIITVGGADTSAENIGIADFSSRGPANGFNKPDIIAPAVDITSCGNNEDYIQISGTSISAPMVAGAAAVILSRRPSYTADKVKEVILKTASHLSCPINACGHGILNMPAILKAL